MIKIAIGAICGVFLGAFAVEFLKKKNPNFLKRIEQEATDLASKVRDALEVEPVAGGPVPPKGHQS